MLQEERHARIRSLVNTFSSVSTERVARDLNVSRETVRRDLLNLETLGALRRVHGGAVTVAIEPEPPLAVRQRKQAAEKQRMAKAALGLVRPGQTLLIDAGTTTAALALELGTLSGLTVITNSIAVAVSLGAANASRDAGNEVVLLGGHIHSDGAAVFGDITIGEIGRYRADMAMLSPVALDAQHGATSFERHECEVARAMCAAAQKTVLLADHSKLGLRSRVRYARIADIDVVVTDKGAQALSALADLRAARCEVLIA
ncbi:DeoR/GlpR family DNA-binding transcription regulator [Variovorax dokdonensis]|uniref:DeoR/GlpR family DNA-binding transcription regulator n=1 Tax=Variovorax dokdonensis TaxID=344883 RepID=A0ABT7NAL5_9BURK|nr:DeoR/GlpR family DNA-binding transcription regulator [Variovorax dokdonensis]MDM0044983.1 DeoR/GlpR family DNA-binding transcription regulator [Variovorax dokdonensis]